MVLLLHNKGTIKPAVEKTARQLYAPTGHCFCNFRQIKNQCGNLFKICPDRTDWFRFFLFAAFILCVPWGRTRSGFVRNHMHGRHSNAWSRERFNIEMGTAKAYFVSLISCSAVGATAISNWPEERLVGNNHNSKQGCP